MSSTSTTGTEAVGQIASTRLTPKQRKAILAGSIGNAVEWVDWALYATLAPVFAGQFFASDDPIVSLLATWPCSPSASSCARSAERS